ncbi:hypothetical protein IRZ71_20655 [Flavobacterium sp. ANB]|uniref:hypothetical protein n=1 Tax=unclassified Flavobacterium TaxID=196869 RepID=UPI0012B6EF63|nr:MULTISPECIES: hypothetical protein [unclassified Flavobacterium]MBF4518773.1 hypothetical protein [Flavobacterium sp. ANB]MTD71514.1 hypothetical protein [Flavobacterium sp. LC2016-13]
MLSRKEMKTIMGGYSGGSGSGCTLTGNEKIIYSGGEPVSYACEWSCNGTLKWGGCSVWG